MQSLYWVVTWACHRKCRHCYDERFRPYTRADLDAVIGEGERAYPRILANLPDAMTWVDEAGRTRPTTIVLAGGELLIDGVRERLFYPLLDAIAARWPQGRPRIAVQTTGDILTDTMLAEMLARGVDAIAIASIDDYHVGHSGQGKFDLMARLRAMMARHGVTEIDLGLSKAPAVTKPALRARGQGGATFTFFGAQPDLWIGELWPRGRAWQNGLSNADYGTNFCARWSGGKGFLDFGRAGSEVAIEPDGSIYPCCLKTKAPLANLVEERLEDVLEDLRAEPALQAINRGDPEAMGLAEGVSRADFAAMSETIDPSGRAFSNPCIGCDRQFADSLAATLAERRLARLQRLYALTD
ncbi:MAG: radical SAM/SPASM domain-containing protein [Sphingomonas sp.]|uniref:SPASM domain-containing protein n=1 Tax=Sphingomonas sp. TaxID=28214 RepID=UPI00183E0E5B|nr:hypothetical protein [Zymomonas sp.]MBA4773843.1 radical SAM/SPASM domain-containing protein [Sphingomonas sp.]